MSQSLLKYHREIVSFVSLARSISTKYLSEWDESIKQTAHVNGISCSFRWILDCVDPSNVQQIIIFHRNCVELSGFQETL